MKIGGNYLVSVRTTEWWRERETERGGRGDWQAKKTRGLGARRYIALRSGLHIFDRFQGRHARFWEKSFRASETPLSAARPMCARVC